jgi:hypothetical protein
MEASSSSSLSRNQMGAEYKNQAQNLHGHPGQNKNRPRRYRPKKDESAHHERPSRQEQGKTRQSHTNIPAPQSGWSIAVFCFGFKISQLVQSYRSAQAGARLIDFFYSA